MADRVVVRPMYDIGQAWISALSQMKALAIDTFINPGNLVVGDVGTYDIFRALIVSHIQPGFETDYVFPILTLHEDMLMSARQMISTQGFSSSFFWNEKYNVPTEFSLADMAFFVDSTCFELKKLILNSWSTGVTVDPSGYVAEPIPLHVATVTTSVAVLSDAETVIAWDSYQLSRGGPASGPDDEFDMEFALPAAPTGMLAPVVDLSGVTAGLNELANQDIDVSLNSGRALFSVRTRVITGS